MMSRVMKHDSNAIEENVFFDNGGFSLITNRHSSGEIYSTTDERSSTYSVICGDILSLNGSELPQSGRAGRNEINTLLRSLEQSDSDVLGQINGVFVGAYFNPSTKSLTVFNDKYGAMPLYYYCDKDIFVFASEVKAILQIARCNEIDWESCADFFYVTHMMENKTLFRNIYALESGAILSYSNSDIVIRKYHDFTATPVLDHEQVSTEKLASLFVQGVSRRIRKDKPNTLLLSGGFDSRLILGAMKKLQFSPSIVSLEHANESNGADGKIAAHIAHSLGLECDLRPSRRFLSSKDSLEAFFILDGMVPSWDLFIGEVYRELDTELGVVWDGLGLDMALGGTHEYPVEAGDEKNLAKFARRRRVNRLLLKLILTPDVFHAMDHTFEMRLNDSLERIAVGENRFDNFRLTHKFRRRIAVNPYQLYSSKVEVMTPALDTDFLDYALGIPRSLKASYRLYIDMVTKHFPFLTEIPVISEGAMFNFDKPQFKGQEKRNNAPVKLMFDECIKMLGRSMLISRDHRRFKLLEEQEVAKLVIQILEQSAFERPFYNKNLLRQIFSSYRNGNGAFHRLFIIVLYIELWHWLFLDRDGPMFFNPKGFQCE